jgi:hypothetical protein
MYVYMYDYDMLYGQAGSWFSASDSVLLMSLAADKKNSENFYIRTNNHQLAHNIVII